MAQVDELPGGTAILRRYARTDLLIFHSVEGELTCFDNICPHAGAPIYPEDFDGRCVTCLYHGLRFSAADGASVDSEGWRLRQFPVRRRGESIEVGWEEDSPPEGGEAIVVQPKP